MPRPNPRDPETDPAAALGEELRLLRIGARYSTQEAFAKVLNWTRESISKVETGYDLPTDKMLTKWLGLCKVPEVARGPYVRMLKLARKAKAEATGVREFFEKYFDAEQAAAFLRMWGVLLIPGPLQTREYAEAIFRLEGLDETEVARQTELRMKRRARVDGPDPAHITALIFESALDFLVGGPEIMIRQLTDLLELSRRRNVIVQVVPNHGYFTGVRGPFEIASGPAISDIVDMVTVEDHVSDEPDVVNKVIEVFEGVRGYALTVAESQKLISEAIERWSQR